MLAKAISLCRNSQKEALEMVTGLMDDKDFIADHLKEVLEVLNLCHVSGINCHAGYVRLFALVTSTDITPFFPTVLLYANKSTSHLLQNIKSNGLKLILLLCHSYPKLMTLHASTVHPSNPVNARIR
jgi:hypothetical protein